MKGIETRIYDSRGREDRYRWEEKKHERKKAKRKESKVIKHRNEEKKCKIGSEEIENWKRVKREDKAREKGINKEEEEEKDSSWICIQKEG